jgi:DNA-binding NtrC family response regulator
LEGLAKNRTALCHKNLTRRILGVDDKISFRDMLIALLKQEDYQVETMSGWVKAINIVQNTEIDLFLPDIKMSRINGIDVLCFIQDNCISTQAIVQTGVGDILIAVEYIKPGAYHYLTKPYTADELNAIIERALERRQLLIENKVMRGELPRLASSSKLSSYTPAFVRVFELTSKVTPTDSTDLIQRQQDREFLEFFCVL